MVVISIFPILGFVLYSLYKYGDFNIFIGVFLAFVIPQCGLFIYYLFKDYSFQWPLKRKVPEEVSTKTRKRKMS